MKDFLDIILCVVGATTLAFIAGIMFILLSWPLLKFAKLIYP